MSRNYADDGEGENNQSGQHNQPGRGLQQYCVWLYHSEDFPTDPRPVSAFWPTLAQVDQRQAFYQESNRRSIEAEPDHEDVPMLADREYRLQHCGQYGYGCACRLYVAEQLHGQSISIEQPGNEIDFQAEWDEIEAEDNRAEFNRIRSRIEYINDEAAKYDLAEYDINAPYRAERMNMKKVAIITGLLLTLLISLAGLGLTTSNRDNPQELYPASSCPTTFTIFGYQATNASCNQETIVDGGGQVDWLVRIRFLIPSLDYSQKVIDLSAKIYQTKFIDTDDNKVYSVSNPDIPGPDHDYIVVLNVQELPKLKHFTWQIEPGNELSLTVGVNPIQQWIK